MSPSLSSGLDVRHRAERFDGEHADWSPDGRLIIFESYGDGAPTGVSTNVFTVHPDVSHLTNVTRDEGGAVNTAYRPDWGTAPPS